MSVDAASGAAGDAPSATHPGDDPASPQLYRALLESIGDYAIFMVDGEGRVATWNRGAEMIKGYRADEIIGRPLATFYTAEDVAAGRPARLLATAASTGRVEDEGWRVRKDGSRLWAGVVITALRDEHGGLRGFAKVTRDLTQRVQLEDERVRAARAEEAVRLREEFLAVASHELRTPLTAMLLGLHGVHERMLAAGDPLADRLSRSLASGRRLAELIERLLDVSRLTNQPLVLTREHVELGELVAQVVDGMRVRAERAGCELRVEGPAAVTGTWDRIRLAQVVSHLLDNALEFGRGQPIDIGFGTDADGSWLRVEDRGPGLDAADRERIFERFERATPMRNHGGLGLGLFLVRRIAEAHAGSIVARARDGGGSSFELRIPAAAGAPT